MEMESFSQCLQYIQHVRTPDTLSKIIPVAGTISGVFIGALLNNYLSKRTEKQTLKNQLTCCSEELERIQADTQQILLECCKIFNKFKTGGKFDAVMLPTVISSKYLDDNFNKISHKYSKEQRERINRALTNIEPINKKPPNIASPGNNLYLYSVLVLNLVNLTLIAWKFCENTRTDMDHDFTPSEILLKIGVTQEQLECFIDIKKNAESLNKYLDIKW